MKPPQVLIVGSSPDATAYLQGLVSSCAKTDAVLSNESDVLERLSSGGYDAVILYLEGNPNGNHKLLVTLHRKISNTPVIVIAERTIDMAEWAGAGAFEVLGKPLDRAAVRVVLQRALTWRQWCVGNGLLPAKTPPRKGARHSAALIGDSEAMQAVYDWISKVALSDANVCLYGESGTGKELVARAIHESGRRRGRPFVVLDCAAIPEGLIESEMFGHVRGAFTSAVGDRIGVLQLADTGTLLLDEVAELPLSLQAKLLRVIQNREFRRVGSSHPVQVDVRLLAATNQDLKGLVQRGHFREDLFYRLDVISITLPPLRQRKEDIPLLVDHFIQQCNAHRDKPIRGVSTRTLRPLLQYDWPGNVRQLQNCIERAGVMAEGDVIDIGDLRQVLHSGLEAGPHQHTEPPGTLRDMEKACIVNALQQTRGNKAAAAALLGISLRGLHYKLKRLKGKSTEAEET
jgi:DNA-binding NtrC family response regulator